MLCAINAIEQRQRTIERITREIFLQAEAALQEAKSPSIAADLVKPVRRAVEIFRTLYGSFPDNPEYGLMLASVAAPFIYFRRKGWLR